MKISINKYSIWALAFLGLFACENQEITFDDFDYTAVYFPFQAPVRTLVLGEDRIDNSLDQELKFNIGVSIGGLYSNGQNWSVLVEYAPELAENLENGDGLPIKPLSEEFIVGTTPSIPGNTTINSGEFNGFFEFQLSDAFLDDSLAFTGQYVIPLRITSSDADSILSGAPVVPDPDKRVLSDWEVEAPPKDFTLFGIKFINEYDGAYLHRGVAIEKDAMGNEISRQVYRQNFIVDDEIWKLNTKGRSMVETTGIGANNGDGFEMRMIINGTDVTIEPVDGANLAASGSGTFVPSNSSSEIWGGQSRNAFYLSYSYASGENIIEVSDTLVMRDRDVIFEENVLQVIE